MDDGLVMEQLKHQDELRSFEHVPLDEQEIESAELDLAVKIIEQRVNESFEPDKYEDIVRSRMLDLIQQKIDGQEIAVPTEEPSEAKIVDLMEALKASVDSKSAKVGASKAGGKTKTTRKTAARAGRKAGAKTATAKTTTRSRKKAPAK